MHTGMIYHILVHIASVIIAVFLTTISTIAYKRNGGSRLLFMTSRWGVLAFVEFLYLLYATDNIEAVVIPIVNIKLRHYYVTYANLVWHRLKLNTLSCQ
jgi:uncharacterized sodium:solute symporter family permease YidK